MANGIPLVVNTIELIHGFCLGGSTMRVTPQGAMNGGMAGIHTAKMQADLKLLGPMQFREYLHGKDEEIL